jgi:glycosyltransferase involved in cell wall biosynthesis
MSEILALATAGLKPEHREDAAHHHHPRVDYLELKRYLDLDVLDYSVYDQNRLGGFLRRLETYLRSDLYLTWLGLLHKGRYRMVFAMSERAGIPFAGLKRAFQVREPLVSMFTCWSSRQERAITRFSLFEMMDDIIVKTHSLKRHFVHLGAPAECIHVIPLGLDHHFYAPMQGVEQQNGLVFSLGEPRNRDYGTLFKAVDGLPLKLLVAAAGSWYAREKSKGAVGTLPSNVTLSRRVSRAALRGLYAQAQFVVLPLHHELASAGATAVLEAMSMGRAVITTRSPGILDYVEDGETAILVDPGDAAGLREAIRDLLAHPAEAKRIGSNARQRIEADLNLDRYVEQVANVLKKHVS